MYGPVIVAYDGSPNAEDAFALGALLADAGAGRLALAHVYRAAQPGPQSSAATLEARERFVRQRGLELISSAAVQHGRDLARYVLGSTTTATGIRTVAESEPAAVVVFGSAERTPPGRVHPGSAARRLLQGCSVPVAFAPVGFAAQHAGELHAVAAAHDDDSGAARASAEALAAVTGARVTDGEQEGAQLLFLGSAQDAERGRVAVNAGIELAIQRADAPVVVVPRGAAVAFTAPSHASAAA
jgi:nucleotide-binding universal stress UspA family protein